MIAPLHLSSAKDTQFPTTAASYLQMFVIVFSAKGEMEHSKSTRYVLIGQIMTYKPNPSGGETEASSAKTYSLCYVTALLKIS